MFLSEYVRIGGAARFLGVSVQTLRLWCKHKKLPHYLGADNKHRYFKDTDLQEIKEKMKNEYGVRSSKRYFRKYKKRRKNASSDQPSSTGESQETEG